MCMFFNSVTSNNPHTAIVLPGRGVGYKKKCTFVWLVLSKSMEKFVPDKCGGILSKCINVKVCYIC